MQRKVHRLHSLVDRIIIQYILIKVEQPQAYSNSVKGLAMTTVPRKYHAHTFAAQRCIAIFISSKSSSPPALQECKIVWLQSIMVD